jgi:hypothetical protein
MVSFPNSRNTPDEEYLKGRKSDDGSRNQDDLFYNTIGKIVHTKDIFNPP